MWSWFNTQVIPLTGPLSTLMHLRSVCFDSKAATQMNVFPYYDSISRGSVIFPLSAVHGLCGFTWTGLPTDWLPANQKGPSQLDTSGWPPGMLEGQDPGDKEWIKRQNKHNHNGNLMVSQEGNIFSVLTCHSLNLIKSKDKNIEWTQT